MNDVVKPVGGPGAVDDRRQADRRDRERRRSDRRAAADSASRDLVPVQPVVEHLVDPPHAEAPVDPASAFAAQLIGQGGVRRGLKGGPPVLDAARSTYLGAEYSGEKDRRPPAGTARKTEV